MIINSIRSQIDLNQEILFRQYKYSNESKSLDLSGSNIRSVDKFTFSGLLNVKSIYLTYNRIDKLDKETFKGLVNLNEIQLAGNRLAKID